MNDTTRDTDPQSPIGRALSDASILMGTGHDCHGYSESDPDFIPPREIQAAAAKISRWMKENGHSMWQLGDVCDRRYTILGSPEDELATMVYDSSREAGC
jgi:hypothetical protein